MLTSRKSLSSLVLSSSSSSTLDDKNIILENGTLIGAIIETNPKDIVKQLRTKSINGINKQDSNNSKIIHGNSSSTSTSFQFQSFHNFTNEISSKKRCNSSVSTDSFSIIIEDENSSLMMNDGGNDYENGDNQIIGDQSICANITNASEILNTSENILHQNNTIIDDEGRCSGSGSSGGGGVNLNLSTCSRESKRSTKSNRKLKKYLTSEIHHGNRLPPQYTAIFLDTGNPIGGGGGAGNHGIQPPTSLTSIEGHLALSVPVIQRTHQNSIQCNVCVRWFSRSSLPFVIGILALGGVACTLGGIVLGSTGLVEHSTQYLSAALLMIGIGVSLLVISGAIWKLSLPDESETCHCLRHIEVCQNCNSPFCNNRIFSTNYHFHEFQHRPPPPSYVTTINECTMGLFVHDSPNTFSNDNNIRISTPPPSYRSCNSLSSRTIPTTVSNLRENNENSLNTSKDNNSTNVEN